MRIMQYLLSGVFMVVVALSTSVAHADPAFDAAVHKLHSGIHNKLCKLNPRQYGEILGLSADDLVDRFNQRSNPHQLFDAMVKACEPSYREALVACSYNFTRCAVEQSEAVPPVMPGLATAVPAQYPLPQAQGPVLPVPTGRPGATALDPGLFETYVKCWAERHPGTTFSREDVLNGVSAKATAENMSLATALATLLNGCNSAPRAPLAIASASAPTTVTAQGGAAVASPQTHVGQQATASPHLSAEQLASAQALSVQRQAQQQFGVVQQGGGAYPVVSTPNHLHADPAAQARQQFWYGARLTSFLHFAWVLGLGINDRRYDVTGDPRFSLLTGLEAGFRLPATPIRLVGDVTLYHNVSTDDVPEESKQFVQNNWGFRGGVKAVYEMFSDSNYPVSVGLGYTQQDWFPARKAQPHAFVFSITAGPLTSWEFFKRVAVEYQLQVAPTAGNVWDQTLTHLIALKVMPWRHKFLNGRF